MSYLCELAKEIHKIAVDHGWWDGDRSDGEVLALVHSEVSECLEALRVRNPQSQAIPAVSAAEEEIADVIIRLLDWSESKGWDISEALHLKMEYNRNRPYKHGGKAF